MHIISSILFSNLENPFSSNITPKNTKDNPIINSQTKVNDGVGALILGNSALILAGF
jgi:midasin (ATPase involved in ribosome maturation)